MTTLRINGATRLYAIVGDPIAQVRSPETISELFAAAGANAVLVPAHILPDQFDKAIPALMGLGNLDGLIATIPYKARILPFANQLGAASRCIGAVNALRREADGIWTGEMFDGVGFVRAVERKGGVLRGRRVVLYGAGGAGSAIAFELASAGVASIAIVDSHAGRSEALVRSLRPAFPACDLAPAATKPADVDMIVNATPVGMRADDGMPAEIGLLGAQTLVGDVVVSESPTALIRHARHHGCNYVTGRDMHSGQLDAIMKFFAPENGPRTR